jgi:hypothetical protein
MRCVSSHCPKSCGIHDSPNQRVMVFLETCETTTVAALAVLLSRYGLLTVVQPGGFDLHALVHLQVTFASSRSGSGRTCASWGPLSRMPTVAA